MARLSAEALTPWTMLFTHVVKVVSASAIMALNIVILTQLDDRHYSVVSVGLDGALL
jgi:hypothetical protein